MLTTEHFYTTARPEPCYECMGGRFNAKSEGKTYLRCVECHHPVCEPCADGHQKKHKEEIDAGIRTEG